MRKLGIILLVGLGLLGCCTSASENRLNKITTYKPHKIAEIEGAAFSSHNLYTVEINGQEYYLTYVHNGFCLGPKVEK